MNQTAILHVVERLERLVTRLPEKIRRPVLRELTPLKELFLQQRPPRFLLIGSSKIPTHRIIDTLFTAGVPERMNVALIPVHRWIDWDISGHGTISILDARDAGDSAEVRGLLSVLTEELPNQAKIEMIRISRDREAQHHVAQMLIKSTTAICTAIGAQPIPLADMPILTSLQVVMVSGIMYISGRERSLRAATEFITALGANVGAGMLLREGARAILKFFPGWGNVVCGMLAGAGTYAIGRAATAFFIGGVSLKDARRKYLADRKKASRKSHWSRGSLGASKSIE